MRDLFEQKVSSAVVRSAVLSDCGLYRYRLSRVWDAELPAAAFVMLNPSVADATQDDRTIRRCVGFARAWGCGGIDVVNLFAFRATKPAALKRVGFPVGPLNDDHIRLAARHAALVVAAWGANKVPVGRVAEVLAMLRASGKETHCLSVTKDGHPQHPLFVRGDAQLAPFPPEPRP